MLSLPPLSSQCSPSPVLNDFPVLFAFSTLFFPPFPLFSSLLRLRVVGRLPDPRRLLVLR